MEKSIDVIAKIKENYIGMSKNHKAIAGFVTEHYDQAVFMTAAQLGEQLGISQSTVVRFAMGLGFTGYPEFQGALAEWVKGQLNSVQAMGVKYAGSTQSEIVNSVLTSDAERIRETLQQLDPQAFDTAVDILLKARNIYIIGLRSCSPLAEFLHFYLNMIRGNIVLVKSTSVTEIFEQMIRMDERDAVVGISFPRYSMRTLKAMEFANDRNAKVIALTDSVHSPMNLYSSCNLLAKSELASIADSLVAPLSVINALVVAMCMKRPQEVKKNLEILEDAWNNYQVYLNDEINFIGDEPL